MTTPPNTIYYNAANGHYYTYVPLNGISWSSAVAAAQTYVDPSTGWTGYLATLTTQAEITFVDSAVFASGRPDNTYLGGSDAAVDGQWRWVTGPESQADNGAGLLFWSNGTAQNGFDGSWAPLSTADNQTSPGVNYLYLYSWFLPQFNAYTGAAIGSTGSGGNGGILVEFSNSSPVASAPVTVSTAENVAAGTTLATASATDPDASTTLTYSISAGNSGGLFAINSSTGAIALASGKALDYETATQHALTVTASDGTLSATQAVTINVTNVNEAPVASAPVTVSTAENVAAGTTLATASATDPDASTTLTYSISAGNSGGLFTINSSTGAISLLSDRSFDYEIQTQHTLTVAVSDGLLTDTQLVMINVTDVAGDVMSGTASANTFAGTVGNDDIYGLAGNDTLDGKGGNDLIDGGDGIDTATYATSTSFVAVDLRIVGAQNTDGAGWDTLVNIENLTGGSDGDSLTGNALANTIDGGDGDDTIDGGAGNDKLVGGINWADGDTLSYASATGGVTINLSLTTAQVTGGAGTDTISTFENVIGSDFNDKLTGTSGSNMMFGGNGADTITGGAGTDYLTGGAGADIFVFNVIADSSANLARDQIFDFAAGDKIDLSGMDANSSAAGNQAFTFIDSARFTGLGQVHCIQKNGIWMLEGNTTGSLAPDFQIELRNGFVLHAGDIVL